MKPLTLGVLLLTAQSSFAQPVTVIPPPPPDAPQWVQPNPEANELLKRGRRKRLAGALLMGLGGGVLLSGTALVAWTFSANNCNQFANTRDCTHDPVMQAGVVGMVLGFGALVAGIPVYVVGNAQVKRAQRMTFSLLPAAGGASLRMEY